MRKSIITVALFFLISSSAMANVFLDVYGAFLTAGDAEYQYGGGGALGVNFLPRWSFLYRGMYTFSSFDVNTHKEKKFEYIQNFLGVEYIYPIPKVYMGWKSSIMIGISQLNFHDKVIKYAAMIPYYDDRDRDDLGITIAFWTGLKFDVSQYVAPFIDIGYFYTIFSDELKDELIHGFHMMVGIRFNLWGKNRDINEEY